jgi:hypothetical protein
MMALGVRPLAVDWERWRTPVHLAKQFILDHCVKEAGKLETECWIWTLAGNNRGYGAMWFDDRRQGAHRVSYQVFICEIPDGMQVLHRCDNPACVNPDHLFLGTAADNTADMYCKGRHYVYQVGDWRCKLTEDDVREARRMRAEGKKYRHLCSHFGVSYKAMWDVVNGVSWKSVTD